MTPLPAASGSRRPWLLLAKWLLLLVIGAGVIAALGTDGVSDAITSVRAFTLPTIAVSVGLSALARVGYTWRWRVINAGAGAGQFSLAYLYRVGLLSEFISIVLPSYLGGDGARLLHLRGRGAPTAPVLVGLVIDRIVGVVTLTLLALALASLLLPYAPESLRALAANAGFIVGAAVLAIAVLAALWMMRSRWWGWVRSRLPESLRAASIDTRTLVLAIAISSIGHLLFAGSYVVLFTALASIDPALALAVTLVALVTRAIPISIAGIEVSDGSIVALAGWVGVGSAVGLAVVAVIVLSRYGFALLGLAVELAADGARILRRDRV
ncbi:MAG: lysylphosphatidylglycerol synthase transmembrane domain-containing protein [Chloroflexota bacterium]|nr:lysylphosphatidylglycerol synthase transmembrane domain-containing protein [Chloroflexota bacterium]